MSPVSTQLKSPNKPGWEQPVGGQHELQQACSSPLHHRTLLGLLHPPTFHLNYSFFFSLNTFKFSAPPCFPLLTPAPHAVRKMVNPHLQVSKVSKLGYDCTVQWDRTRVSDTRLIFFFSLKKLICWNMRKQNSPPMSLQWTHQPQNFSPQRQEQPKIQLSESDWEEWEQQRHRTLFI